MTVTFASMIMTDGTQTVIGIYRGPLQGPKGKRYINFEKSSQIGTVTVRGGDHIATVNRLASEYATPDAPAVDWNL